MSIIDWDGAGIEYFTLGSPKKLEGDVLDAEIAFSDLNIGDRVRYDASKGRKVTISILGMVSVYPVIEAVQFTTGGNSRTLHGQLKGCDDGQGGDPLPFVLAPEHAPIIYSGRQTPHELRLPTIQGLLHVVSGVA